MNKLAMGQMLIKAYNRRFSEGGLNQQESMKWVGMAANSYIRNFMWALQKAGDYATPYSFLKEHTAGVTKDDTRDEWYVELPYRTFNMLGKNRGVHQVFPEGDDANLLVPTLTGFKGMYNGLAAELLESRTSYRLLGDKLYINGKDVGSDYRVTMLLIPDCAGLSEDEELPLPPDGEYEVMELAMNLIKIKMGLPSDVQINNLDN